MKNDFEDQLDEIRIKLYEETKHMNTKEAADTINTNAKKLAEKYGITIVKEAARKSIENIR